ncbi:site-2 protease family protein [Adhaeribacter radiodurans]|uniref:Site-2 protease family protein n=1 Tax=Adhaeribacter radiodurans TaxID=2745197 RepID=A0A7L7LAV9_9BACT|nr:site-2 protease family protein [Adhaeribacter radiodurans]QMU29685.1 site-2 protease family protein [Adhaeribacter radiodurans]
MRGSSTVKNYTFHLFLFCLALVTTTLAGAEWMSAKPLLVVTTQWRIIRILTNEQVLNGLYYSLPFLGVLTAHEFGHYFTARYYRIRVSLPYYIPFWFPLLPTIGTMGAVIRIKDRIFSKKEFFDVGIAGPLAGFIVAIPLLWYGFTHLPSPEHIFTIHPEYKKYGLDYASKVYQNTGGSMALGKNLLFLFFEKYVAPDPALVPNQYELMHYPYLFAGFLSLFFTAMNLLPIGQLDGGHILYGLIGFRNFNRISPVFFIIFIFYAGLGVVGPHTPPDERYWQFILYAVYLYVVFEKITPNVKIALTLTIIMFCLHVGLAFIFPGTKGYPGWLVFGLLLSRLLGIFHPPAPDEAPLSTGRKVLGWFAVLIFLLSFSPAPFLYE